MDVNAYRELFHSVKKKYKELREIVDTNILIVERNRLQEFTVNLNFWDDNVSAQKILKQISKIENEIKIWNDLDRHYNDSDFYMDAINNGEDMDLDSIDTLKSFSKVVEKATFV